MCSGMAIPGGDSTANMPGPKKDVEPKATTTSALTKEVLNSKTDLHEMLRERDAIQEGILHTSTESDLVEEGLSPLCKIQRLMRDTGVYREAVELLTSTSQTVDKILAAVQQPTLASNPEFHTRSGEGDTPAMWSVEPELTAPFFKYSAHGRLLDDEYPGTILDTMDLSISTAPSVLTLMRMMGKQIAAQRGAIAELKAKNADSESRGVDVHELMVDVHKLNEWVELHASTIEQLKEDKASQHQLSVDSTKELKLVKEVNKKVAEQASTIDMLKATIDSQASKIEQLRVGKGHYCHMIQELEMSSMVQRRVLRIHTERAKTARQRSLESSLSARSNSNER